jgi:tRNA dimethylallyltransferase
MTNWINGLKENSQVLLLVGPTASGKTELSILIAKALGGEIVSADSRQVYRYMDIGTAKPTREERAGIPHHFIDIRTPEQYYSAGEYGHEARHCIEQLMADSIVPIVVGGSGFYVEALVDGLFAPQVSDPGVKEQWRERIRQEGVEKVYAVLQRIDPVTARRLHPNDEQRIVRALEVFDISGVPISAFRETRRIAADFKPVFVGLLRNRKSLNERIETRVDNMIRHGLVEEVEALKNMGYSPRINALRTVGYQEVFEYLDGTVTFAEMVAGIKAHTRQYAKRQMTWFRRDPRIFWIEVIGEQGDDIASAIIQHMG